ncbi:hypothetical protein PV327_000598 [Microctonus hyperodae]|uniref:Uncharacterized protein n=1 Tax=Microctonus hyperodae TaxID=165561 RepID=A0AA39L2F6_MICHY|nr:hypothetical protein PV327_000598 [Microctonus hyperodae]
MFLVTCRIKEYSLSLSIARALVLNTHGNSNSRERSRGKSRCCCCEDNKLFEIDDVATPQRSGLAQCTAALIALLSANGGIYAESGRHASYTLYPGIEVRESSWTNGPASPPSARPVWSSCSYAQCPVYVKTASATGHHCLPMVHHCPLSYHQDAGIKPSTQIPIHINI